MLSKNLLLSFLLIAINLYVTGQNLEKIKESAFEIKNVDDWCSTESAFKSAYFEEEQPPIKVSPHPLSYGKWFHFKATGQNALVKIISTGKKKGIQFPYLALFTKDLKELQSVKYSNETDDLGLSYNHLQKGESYFIAVFNHNNSDYVGEFSLCVNSQINNNWKEGAKLLKTTSKYCSKNEEFSTSHATSSQPGSRCLDNQSHFNKWFLFQAKTTKISIIAEAKDGSPFLFPIVTLYDEKLDALACEKYSSKENKVELNYNVLTKGAKYYFSVDHLNNHEYRGGFNLCLEDGFLEGDYSILGKINPSEENKGKKVHLLDAKTHQDLAQTQSDNLGKFEFKKLPRDIAYVIEIENTDPGKIDLNLFLTNKDDKIIGKGKAPTSSGKYGVELLDKENDLSFFNDPLKELDLKEGKRGVIGKVVQKDDVREGVQGLKVSLLSPFHENPMHTMTDVNGDFSFNDLDPSQDYAVEIADHDPGDHYTEMVYVNNKGNIIMKANSNNVGPNGMFNFTKLPSIEEKLDLIEFDDDQMINMSIESGKTLELNTIYFETGKEAILNASNRTLNKLALQLKAKANLKIEIIGHTDNSGDENFNLNLSKKRADKVKSYLIEKGIDTKRITTNGLGESKPIGDNNTEEGRRKNRRVELRFD
jgi:outer membrane protein OmpA-like peptidoglycan-associated protein